MISFGPSEEQEMVRDAMREFAADAIRPIARECDEASEIPSDFLETTWSLGLTSTQIPEEYGGAGEERSMVTNAILLEELAYGDASLAMAALAPSLFANAILDQGSPDQKKAYLPLYCGESFATGAVAVSEPGAFKDASVPQTIAEPKGDAFILSGRKTMVVYGDRADHFLITARHGDELGAFIVPRNTEGLTIGGPEKNMGLHGLTTTSLELERVEVAADSLLGEGGGADVQRLLNVSRAGLSAVMLGLSRAVLEYCVPYTKERIAFDEPISKKQAIAFRLSDMHIAQHSMRMLVWQAASLLEHGENATKAAWQARNYAAEKSMWIADNGVQILGGHGFIREHPVEMWFRNARMLGVVDGMVAI
ncbi:MAG: acyl-CoA dehydrogenase family protein [Myxococcota bacterium]